MAKQTFRCTAPTALLSLSPDVPNEFIIGNTSVLLDEFMKAQNPSFPGLQGHTVAMCLESADNVSMTLVINETEDTVLDVMRNIVHEDKAAAAVTATDIATEWIRVVCYSWVTRQLARACVLRSRDHPPHLWCHHHRHQLHLLQPCVNHRRKRTAIATNVAFVGGLSHARGARDVFVLGTVEIRVSGPTILDTASRV